MVIVIRSSPVPPNNIVDGNRSRLVSSIPQNTPSIQFNKYTHKHTNTRARANRVDSCCFSLRYCTSRPAHTKQYIREIKNVFFFKERGPKFYVLNHLADLARRRLRRKLLSIQPRKIKYKNCTMFQSRVTVVSKKVQMVSKVARNRFVSREKRHICCNGVGSWSIVSTKVLNGSHGQVLSFEHSQ